VLDTPNYTPKQLNALRRFFHGMNYFMVFMLRLGLGRMCEWWPEGFGRIMVIEHRGRRSGKHYTTPVNYAPANGDVYCLAGFGPADRLVPETYWRIPRCACGCRRVSATRMHTRLRTRLSACT